MPGVYPQFKKSVAKTASYTIKASEHDYRFSNFGAAGAVTFTLPPIADVWDGWSVDVSIMAGQTVTITAPSGKLIAGNNAGATSIAFSTASEKIGNGVTIFYDANAAKYFAQVHLAYETMTPTIA